MFNRIHFRILSALSLCIAANYSNTAIAQTSNIHLNTPSNTIETAVPDDINPNHGSGWLKIELAVLIDDHKAGLKNEFWPLFPEPRYPENHRWLVDPSQINRIRKEFPTTIVTQDKRGAITIAPSDPVLSVNSKTPNKKHIASKSTLPTAFMKQPVNMLQRGLDSIAHNNSDRIELSISWLQPPNAPSLPIILDHTGDSNTWPPLQGFVELHQGNPMQLSINFWWNTSASYYPESYSMHPPPRSPTQITLLDELSSSSQTGIKTASKNQHAWPWRHVIQITDTRTLPEGSVRYFDHPVVKVIAIWRELSWNDLQSIR